MAELAVVVPLPEPDVPATVLPATAPLVTAPPATVPASNKKRKVKGKSPVEPASAADALQVKHAAKRKGKGPSAAEFPGSKKPKTGDVCTMAELPRSDGQMPPPPNMTPPPVSMKFKHIMRELQGAILVGSVFQVILGYTGLMSLFLR